MQQLNRHLLNPFETEALSTPQAIFYIVCGAYPINRGVAFHFTTNFHALYLIVHKGRTPQGGQ